MLQAVHDAAVVRQLEVIEEQLASTWKNRAPDKTSPTRAKELEMCPICGFPLH
jgi:hypothetical protein